MTSLLFHSFLLLLFQHLRCLYSLLVLVECCDEAPKQTNAYTPTHPLNRLRKCKTLSHDWFCLFWRLLVKVSHQNVLSKQHREALDTNNNNKNTQKNAIVKPFEHFLLRNLLFLFHWPNSVFFFLWNFVDLFQF